MLSLDHVSFCYPGRKNKNVIEDISLEFSLGKFYSIFGPSGSGKTTVLSLLGGLDRPTKGDVIMDGVSISDIGGRKLRQNHVSYVFQDFKLFPYMTAVENVLLAMSISKPHMKKSEAGTIACTSLKRLGLDEEDFDRKVARLSGGQQQRVAIARTLALDVDYILADEPTGNLDEDNTDVIIDIFRQLVNEYNKCVIVVTHSAKVRDSSDICYNIVDGKLVDTV